MKTQNQKQQISYVNYLIFIEHYVKIKLPGLLVLPWRRPSSWTGWRLAFLRASSGHVRGIRAD